MSQLGQYKIPRELQDEDKWLKYFTKKQLVTIIAVLIVDWKIVSFFSNIHLAVVGVTIAVLITVVTGVIAMATMPKTKYLFGGGVPLDKLVVRVIKRRLLRSSKVVYTKMEAEEDGGNK